ncbi:MAG: DNA-deoxyinosine glycosylase [Erysipelotrichaceae bacterium]
MLKGLQPLSSKEPRILILGSMPSLTSLEVSEYYAYKLNRFWTIMQCIYGGSISNYNDKKNIIYDNHLALWDSIGMCERIGSLDSSIKNVIPNPIEEYIRDNPTIQLVVCNGKKSHTVYNRYFGNLKIRVVCLPSTSNANTTSNFEVIKETWINNFKSENF